MKFNASMHSGVITSVNQHGGGTLQVADATYEFDQRG